MMIDCAPASRLTYTTLVMAYAPEAQRKVRDSLWGVNREFLVCIAVEGGVIIK